MNKKLKNNISLDFLFRFFCNFAIVDGIFILYLAQKGLPLWQIGILEAIFHVASLISEIPSGALADLLGRKQVLLASRLCGIISSCIMIFANHIWMLGIGFVFTAWSYNLLSGSEEALLYDSLLELKSEEKYFKINGKLEFIAEVSQGIAIFLGGFLAKYSYLLCYVILIDIDFVASFIVCRMEEPKVEQERQQVSVKAHFMTCYVLIKDNSKIRYLLIHYSILTAFYTSVFLYSQSYYFAQGFDEAQIGLILLGTSGCASIGALFSEKIAIRFEHYVCYGSGIALALGLLLMSGKVVWISILGFYVGSVANVFLHLQQSKELNKRIPSAQRATVLSVSGMFFSMVMIILFPLIGLFADYIGLSRLILMLGLLLLFYNHFVSR